MTSSTSSTVRFGDRQAGIGERPLVVGRAPTVVHVTTVAVTLRFLSSQFEGLRRAGFSPAVIASPGAGLEEIGDLHRIPRLGVRMTRSISPAKDLLALLCMVRALRLLNPDIVHAHTPKAGLLTMIAGAILRLPIRVYTIHGFPFSTAHGVKRLLLTACDRLSCKLATRVICVSRSVAALATQERICDPGKLKVLANGSVAGVDAVERFEPAAAKALGRKWRASMHIPAESLVIGYIGRLAEDKGIHDLLAAWEILKTTSRQAILVLIGPMEAKTPELIAALERLRADASARVCGPDWDTPKLYAAMDIFCLPSYREGFPVVLLEAASMGLPIVTTTVTGCIDAVVHGITGTLTEPRDAKALSVAIKSYLEDPELRRRHGDAARRRVCSDFTSEPICRALIAEYSSALQTVGRATTTDMEVFRADGAESVGHLDRAEPSLSNRGQAT